MFHRREERDGGSPADRGEGVLELGGQETSLRLVDDEHDASCVHHWILSEPANGVVAGRCKRCAAQRAFPASPEGGDRFDDYRELTQSSTYYERRSA